MIHQLLLLIEDSSQISDARRQAVELARLADFGEIDRGRVALVVTEAATNILKHANHGTMLMRLLATGTPAGIEILALDDGPGLGDATLSFADGHSTVGTSGTGLGAMKRMADEFDWYSTPEHGSIFRMALWKDKRAPALRIAVGAVCVPLPGQHVAGDDWRLVADGNRYVLMVCDGLGHGLEAHRAASTATALLDVGDPCQRSVTDLLLAAHEALRSTRGAAMSAATIDLDAHAIRYAGVGNVASYVCDGKSRRQLISHNGIVGHTLRKLQAFDVQWESGGLLIMHSDGLSSQWSFAEFPDLENRHPAVIAAMIYKNYWRKRDDVTVIVLAAL